MSLPWSGKGSKATPIAADELMIIDSADANPSTQNKRITIGTLPVIEVTTWTADHDAAGFDLLNVGGITVNNPLDSFQYIITPSAITADRILNLPLLTSTDTLVAQSLAQTLTNKTFPGVLPNEFEDDGLVIQNPANTFNYTFQSAALAADRILNLPLLTGTDTFVTEAFTQTLTNKTLDDFSNTNHADTVHIQVRNETGGPLTQGVVVFISGFSVPNDLPLIDLADANSAATMPSIGIVTDTIADNTNGDVTVSGQLLGPSTTGLSPNATLYVSETAGEFTDVKPTGTALIQNIGTVLKVNGAGTGIIKVTSIDRTNDLPNIPSAQFWVGNASAVPTAVTMGGDATMDNTGAVTLLTSATEFFGPWTANHDAGGFDLLNVGGIQINNPADTFQYIITPTAIAADRILNLPLLTGTDTFVTAAFIQTLTNKTFDLTDNTLTGTTAEFNTALSDNDFATLAGIESLTNKTFNNTNEFEDDGLIIQNPADTFNYIFQSAAIVADRILNLPLLTSGDTLVTEGFAQTLTNKTIDGDLNTIVDINETQQNVSVGVAGTILTSNGVGLPPTYQANDGAQTPWTSDIDADGWDLNDLSNLEFRESVSVPPTTAQAIYVQTNRLKFNSPNRFQYNINGSTRLTLENLQLILDVDIAMGSKDIIFTPNTLITDFSGSRLEYKVPTGETHNFFVNNIEEYVYSATEADFKTNKIVNLADPTLAQDGATKNYVDSFVQGTIKWKEPVLVATTGSDLTLSGEQTIDGILTSSSRILVKDQALGQQNGIYVTDGDAWARAIDFDASDEIVNGAMWVSEGTLNADQAFVCTTDDPIVVGTTVLTFVQFSGLGQITTGTNLSKTGNTINFDPTGNVDMLANDLINATQIGIGVSTPTHNLEILGNMNILHTATASSNHAIEIFSDAAGFGDIKALNIAYTTGSLIAGEEEGVMLVNIDQTASTGGEIFGIEVLSTTIGVASISGLKTGIGIDPLNQLSGTFANADTILVLAVDQTTALSAGGAGNISVFVADDDTITIGSSAKFQEIEFIVDTGGSAPGTGPTFEFSTGVGTWLAFTPVDGTNGLQNSGGVIWDLDGIPTWAVGTGSEFLIRITRTTDTMATTPILDLIQVAAATVFSWDNTGSLIVNSVNTNAFTLNNPAVTFNYILTPAAIAADRILNLPLMTGTDTMALEAFPANLTNKTFNNTNEFEDDGLVVQNPADTFNYIFQTAAIIADRTITLPLLTGNDTVVTEAHAQTLTNKTIDGDDNTIVDINETQQNVSVGAAGTILTSNGVGVAPSYQANDGAQTPWTSDIDADGFDLTDLSNLEFRVTTGAPGITVPAIYFDAVGMQINVPTAKKLTMSINGTDEYLWESTQMDLLANNIRNAGFVESAAALPANAGALRLGNNEKLAWRNIGNTNNIIIEVDTSDDFRFLIDGTPELVLSATQLDLQGNNLINVGLFESNAVNPAQSGTVRLGDGQSIAWRNGTNDGDFSLSSDTSALTFNGWTEVELPDTTFVDMASAQVDAGTLSVFGVLSFLDANTSLQQATTDLQIDVATGGTQILRVNNVTEYTFSATEFTLGDANNIVLNATTGTKIGTATTQKLSFYGVTPVVQPTALTTQETTITFVEPGTPDFAIQTMTSSSPWGFETQDEGNTFVGVVENLQVRLDELETKLQALGLLA